ncbi:enoyl-CoA hydratase-related protein [Sporosarcina sp. 179-K 3D1 HS]|uniref:enoyl-CoA hydratase/isomerase family protein n=1 Tax=Sporosarcina sp. 179-K 3D1 HS TaxID=3232169 RepID=UPI0039A3B346
MVVKNEIATVYLNEPETLNALSQSLKEKLLLTLEEVEKRSDIKIILLAGNGRAFCAGGDIKAMGDTYDPLKIKDGMEISGKIIRKIREMPKIVICTLHGYAAGAGMSIALAADLIVAEESTKFVLSFKNVGLIPDLGLHYHLPNIIGEWRAKEWMWSGKTISVDEAVQLGFVNQKVPQGELLKRAFEMAEELSKGPFDAYIASKEIINSRSTANLNEVIARENTMQTILRGTEQHTRSVKVFLSKSK